ncbi:hypothetical protein GQ55_7G249700 [Panicum hallii var. hallii]|uniref:Uncharacterized protein n=1 Tax=Panicum hallii var. hallii TaxID=1504633 RepID=A0A2T7CYU4_9POAL|nr:hypothetical protein GQ55_7G249700 [Panicum hallii var. hallii]
MRVGQAFNKVHTYHRPSLLRNRQWLEKSRCFYMLRFCLLTGNPGCPQWHCHVKPVEYDSELGYYCLSRFCL